MVTKKKATKNTTAPVDMETRIAIVVDRSGSMSSIKTSTIETINGQIAAIKKNAKNMGDTFVTYITFNELSAKVFSNREISTIYPITPAQYNPTGGTALLDAMGDAIMELQARPITHADTAYLVIVITDGEENSSRRYSKEQIASLTTQLTSTDKWTFTYAMANLTDFQMAQFQQTYGVSMDNTVKYSPDSAGMKRVELLVEQGISGYGVLRSAKGTKTDFFFKTPPTSDTTP